MGIPRDWRGLTWWTIAFVAGVLLIAYAPGAWPALGTLIVAPTVITLMLFAWGFLLYRLAKLFGGNPKSNDSFGLWVYVSFAFLIVPLVVAWLSRR